MYSSNLYCKISTALVPGSAELVRIGLRQPDNGMSLASLGQRKVVGSLIGRLSRIWQISKVEGPVPTPTSLRPAPLKTANKPHPV